MKNIEVINYVATYENGEEVLVLGTYDSYGVEKLHVTFDKYWDDCLQIIASFKNNGLKTEVLVDSEGYVEVPPQATKYPTAKGVVSTLTFLGVKNGGQILSNDLKYKVLNHTEVQGQSPETTPSAWEKLVANLGIPYFHINEEGELIVSLGAGVINAYINEDGDLIAELSNDKTLNLGRVKNRTIEFRLTDRLLEFKHIDETEWSTVVDFSTIASSFDLRLNEETMFLEVKRNAESEWEKIVDLSVLSKAKEDIDDLTSLVGSSYSNRLFEHFGIDKAQYPYIFIIADTSVATVYFANTLVISNKDKEFTIANYYKISGSTEYNPKEIGEVIKGCLNLDAEKLSYSSNPEIVSIVGNVYYYTNDYDLYKENIYDINLSVFDADFVLCDEVYGIKKDIYTIREEMSEFAPPQLVEGILYSDKSRKGLSANRNAVPTADYVWIEGNASNYHSFDELISSATLNVVTSTVNKSTTTTVTINIVCINSDSASFVKNTLSSGGYHMGVVFEDTPDKSFYIKISSATISNTTVSVEFTFIDGQETFPITGNITRNIKSVNVYPKNGVGSHSEGLETIAVGDYSHVQGKYNEIDAEGKYAHIVGNGTDEDNRSNAHTLDWEGNAWYAGSISARKVNYDTSILPDTLLGMIGEECIVSMTTDLNWRTNLPTSLKPNTEYLIEYDENKAFYTTDSRGGISSESTGGLFYIWVDDSLGGLYSLSPADISVAHTVKISQAVFNTASIISYIDKLRARIEALEAKQETE